MLRKIYFKFPILTWLLLHILLFFIECAVKKIGGSADFLAFIIAIEAVITLCISCVVSLKRTELWLYKAVRIVCILPIIILTCMLFRETIMDQIDGKDLYAEVEAMYGCLKDYEFEKMEINADENNIILYSNRQPEEGDEKAVIDVDDSHHDALKYLSRKIKNARTIQNGILFADGYTWDGDWYALYVSENPDIQWLDDLNAKQIASNIYEILVPQSDL